MKAYTGAPTVVYAVPGVPDRLAVLRDDILMAQYRLDEAADALPAIASRQAVVPLVWRSKENYSTAETPFGEYTVTRYEESDGIGWEAVYQDAEVIGTFPTEADARNACDALHTQRINSALAAPVRDETELQKAAQAVYDKLASETGTVTIFDQERLGDALRALAQQAKPQQEKP